MTKTLTIRLPASLAQELRAKARSAKTNPTAVLRQMAAEYVRGQKPAATPCRNIYALARDHGMVIARARNF